jgi:hypothetical protein
MNVGGMFGKGKFMSSIVSVILLNGNSGLGPGLEMEGEVTTFLPPYMVVAWKMALGLIKLFLKPSDITNSQRSSRMHLANGTTDSAGRTASGLNEFNRKPCDISNFLRIRGMQTPSAIVVLAMPRMGASTLNRGRKL